MKAQRWVLVESGSTQDFVFQSNRQTFHVGASALVTDLEKWAREAAAKTTGISVVAAISGSAALLADSEDEARELVRMVTKRALDEAPGLDVWGYVESDKERDTSTDPMDRLPAAHHTLARARASRPAPKHRFPMMPFLERCPISGLPAVTTRTLLGTEGQPVSALTDAAWRRAKAAHHDWQKLLGDSVVTALETEMEPEGWIAVIHVDGNGIGSIIDSLESTSEYSRFSEALAKATRESFVQAAAEVGQEHWLLPILAGGDDITVSCRASAAVPFVRAYLRAFEQFTKVIEVAVGPAHGHLTATAGIAFVKPHHPFHDAHALAQQLTQAAKSALKEHNVEHRSAWDFHVLHDSLARPLDVLREQIAGAIITPLLVSSEVDPPQFDRWQTGREDGPLLAAVDELLSEDPPLSNRARHELRTALLQPTHLRADAVTRVANRIIAVGGTSAERFVTEQISDKVKNGSSALLTLMDLADISTGTARTEG